MPSARANFPSEQSPPASHFFPVKESGIDWLTVTCTDHEKRARMRDLAARCLDHERKSGCDIAPWNFLGYVGLHAGGVGFGEIDEMSLLRLSGPAAWSNWCDAFRLSTNCSRIDLQVTVTAPSEPFSFILDHEREALAFVKDWPRPPNVELRRSNVSSPTLYLNKRVSSRFGRCYDKGTHSKLDHYANCMRYEVQYNGKAAQLVASRLAVTGGDDARVQGRVHTFFREKGVEPRWRWEAPRINDTVPRSRSDADRRLSWLRAQVRGCIRDLIDRGLRNEVLSALGLDGDVP